MLTCTLPGATPLQRGGDEAGGPAGSLIPELPETLKGGLCTLLVGRGHACHPCTHCMHLQGRVLPCSFTGGQRTSCSRRTRGSTHLLLQAHPCPGSSATFSNPGKKNCGRFGLALFFWVVLFGFKLGAVQHALMHGDSTKSPFLRSLLLPCATSWSGPFCLHLF